jgi:hypothetical protein
MRALINSTLIFLIIELIFSQEQFPTKILNLKPPESSPFNTIDLYDLDNNLHGIQLTIGYPPQKFLLLFDTTTEYTWLRGSSCNDCTFSKVFQENDSQTLIKTNMTLSFKDLNQNMKGEISLDYLSIKIFSATNMPFLIVNEDYFLDGVDGIIGFGYGGRSDTGINFSILDKLKENNQIKERIFTVQLHDELSSSLFIGKVPPHIQDNLGNLTNCNVNTTLNSWNCQISHILVGNEMNFYKAIPIHKFAIFSSTVNNLIIPSDLMQFFMKEYFEQYPGYESKFCYVKPDGRKFFILCNMKYFDINKAPMLSLIINGYAYNIPAQELFEQLFTDAYNQYYFLKIVFMDTPDNMWVLGTNFMRQYEVVFNKETNQVGFYNGPKYDLTKFTGDRKEFICWYNFFVYVFLISLVGFSMGYMIYKKQKENDIIMNGIYMANGSNKPLEKELRVYNN